MAFYGHAVLNLEGNFAAPPVLTHTQNGTAKCTFAVYVNFPPIIKEGSEPQKRPPVRVNCVAWRNTAEYIAKVGAEEKSISGMFTLAENKWEELKDGVKIIHQLMEATPMSGTILNIFTVVRKGERSVESNDSADSSIKADDQTPATAEEEVLNEYPV